MSTEAGFTIDGIFYEPAVRIRMRDPVLVRDLTGLEFDEFAKRVDALTEGKPDLLIVAGLVGMAVWQANPKWTREEARQFVEKIDLTEIDWKAAPDPPAQGDASPPSLSLAPSDESTSSPDHSVPEDIPA